MALSSVDAFAQGNSSKEGRYPIHQGMYLQEKISVCIWKKEEQAVGTDFESLTVYVISVSLIVM